MSLFPSSPIYVLSMFVEFKREGDALKIIVLHPRIDGENHIWNAVQKENLLQPDVGLLEFDLGRVEYMNSLGITEFVNIHRRFLDTTKGRVKLRFINVERKIMGILALVELDKVAEVFPRPPQ